LGRHVAGLSRAQAAAGTDVTVLTQQPDGLADDEVAAGVRVVRSPVRPADLGPDGLLHWVHELGDAMIRRAEDALAAPPVDLVHAHDWVGCRAGEALARAWGVPLVATLHATEAGLWSGWLDSPLSQGRHALECRLVQQAKEIIVCSEAMRAEVTSFLGALPAAVHVVPNGVDAARWANPGADDAGVRARLGLPEEGSLLVLAGRVEFEKGGHVAIDALPAIRHAHPGTHLVIAGVGSRLDDLREQARRRHVARAVSFPGRVPGRDLAALMRQADVALAPSSYEPFGIVAIEALAAGTAVVAADVGGLRDPIRNGRTGLLVPPGNPTALARAVNALLDDAALRHRFGLAGKRHVRMRFTWPCIAERTGAIYERVVREWRAPGAADDAAPGAAGTPPAGGAVTGP
jgi:glycogen(starch) synthase